MPALLITHSFCPNQSLTVLQVSDWLGYHFLSSLSSAHLQGLSVSFSEWLVPLNRHFLWALPVPLRSTQSYTCLHVPSAPSYPALYSYLCCSDSFSCPLPQLAHFAHWEQELSISPICVSNVSLYLACVGVQCVLIIKWLNTGIHFWVLTNTLWSLGSHGTLYTVKSGWLWGETFF